MDSNHQFPPWYRNTRFRFTLFVAMALISLSAIGSIVYFSWQQRTQTSLWENGQAAWREKRPEAARELLLQLLENDPTRIDACLLLATIYESENQFYRAASCYARIARLDPQDREASLKEAVLLLRTGEAAAALTLFEQQQKNTGKTLPAAYQPPFLTALLRTGKQEQLRRELEKTPPAQRADYWKFLHEITATAQLPPAQLQEKIRHFRYSKAPEVRFAVLTAAADFAMRQADWKQARKYLEAADQFEPLLNLMRHAHLARLSGDPAGEQQYLEKRRQFCPDDLVALAALADIYAANNNPAGIRALLQEFQPRTRTGLETRYYLEAALDFLAARPHEVLYKLQLARHLDNRQFYHAMLFDAHLRQRDYQKLRENIAGILRYTEAPQAAGSAISRQLEVPLQELNPQHPKDYEKINLLLREMLLAAPAKSPARRAALLQAVRLESQRNHPENVRGYAERLYREFPDAATRLILLDSLIAAHAPQQALPLLNSMPSGLARTIRLGRIREQMGDHPSAEAAFRAGVTAAPQSLLAATELATYLLRQQRDADAVTVMRQLPPTPENQYTTNGITALAAMHAGDVERAENCYRHNLELLEKQPDSAENQLKKAIYFNRLNQPAEAEKSYEAALRQLRPDTSVLIGLSDVKAALGKLREADNYAEQARQLDPGAPEVQACIRRRNADARPR